ncbi:MAG: hypothetical protein DSZ08_04200 [Sulfurovum sp.]|nr:MAG: hypothetical protein DSZ08_04200 [Sulfurovum sp.]
MAYTKAYTSTKLIDPQPNLAENNAKLSPLIKLSGLDITEHKKVFEGTANICEGHFGLWRGIYR